ncbi:MAG: DUF1565 domain-containing protein, partial [Candidatus Omnitrophica bacterium]|nr:DUF1565 domain-containing protein [Candidatus Omnitrophota bacterium]
MSKRCVLGFWVFLSGFLLISSVFSAELYVDQENPKSADTNSGTEQAPFKTIAQAAGKLQPGDTVYVKPGIYREQVIFPAGKEDARISIRAYDKKSRPVISGSEVITSKWILSDVKVKYEGTQPVKIYTTPLEAYTQMVFVDDVQLKQIGIYKSWPPEGDTERFKRVDGKGPEDMRPGTFYYDRDKKILYIWLVDSSDPSNKNIEASVRDYGVSYSGYTTISGFEVKNCQLEPNKGCFGIACNGKKIIIEDCYAHHNDFIGISVNGEDSIIRNNEVSDNGFVGFTCSWGIRNLWDGNVTHNNNTRR